MDNQNSKKENMEIDLLELVRQLWARSKKAQHSFTAQT
jgi:LPS O-antigen subunit length determinant protein (WzzB/FepE family)